MDSNRFRLQNAIKKILDDPNSRPALPDGTSVGDSNFGEAAVYDTGTWPSVALNNGNVVVEVHKSEKRDRLFYHVGRVNGDKIDWHESYDYDDGVQPSVAITNDGLVVEVHKSQSRDRLFYRVGKVEGDKINWGKYEGNKSDDYDDGVQPSVAITNDGLVVEVHKSQTYDTLWYRVGKVEGDKINWGKYEKKQSEKYDDGVQPSVAITNDGLVVEVHKSQNYDTLWHRVGRVNNDTITGFDYGKSQSKKYSSNGTVPKVACNGQLAVETHNEGSDKLLCSILTLPEQAIPEIEDGGTATFCENTGLIESSDQKLEKRNPGDRWGTPDDVCFIIHLLYIYLCWFDGAPHERRLNNTDYGRIRIGLEDPPTASGSNFGRRPVLVEGVVMPVTVGRRDRTPEPIAGWSDRWDGRDIDRGHLFALNLGGPDEPQNIVPQWAHWQRLEDWRAMERTVRDRAVQELDNSRPFGGGSPERSVFLRVEVIYPTANRHTLRSWAFPSRFRVTAYVCDRQTGNEIQGVPRIYDNEVFEGYPDNWNPG